MTVSLQSGVTLVAPIPTVGASSTPLGEARAGTQRKQEAAWGKSFSEYQAWHANARPTTNMVVDTEDPTLFGISFCSLFARDKATNEDWGESRVVVLVVLLNKEIQNHFLVGKDEDRSWSTTFSRDGFVSMATSKKHVQATNLGEATYATGK